VKAGSCQDLKGQLPGKRQTATSATGALFGI